MKKSPKFYIHVSEKLFDNLGKDNVLDSVINEVAKALEITFSDLGLNIHKLKS